MNLSQSRVLGSRQLFATRGWHPQKRVELVVLGRQGQGLLLALREGLLGPGQQQLQLLSQRLSPPLLLIQLLLLWP